MKSLIAPATDQAPNQVQPTIAARIAQLESELRALRAEQRAEFINTIAIVVGLNVAFSSNELWEHQQVSADLRSCFDAAGIHSRKQLGKRLRAYGLTRLKENADGVLWVVDL